MHPTRSTSDSEVIHGCCYSRRRWIGRRSDPCHEPRPSIRPEAWGLRRFFRSSRLEMIQRKHFHLERHEASPRSEVSETSREGGRETCPTSHHVFFSAAWWQATGDPMLFSYIQSCRIFLRTTAQISRCSCHSLISVGPWESSMPAHCSSFCPAAKTTQKIRRVDMSMAEELLSRIEMRREAP